MCRTYVIYTSIQLLSGLLPRHYVMARILSSQDGSTNPLGVSYLPVVSSLYVISQQGGYPNIDSLVASDHWELVTGKSSLITRVQRVKAGTAALLSKYLPWQPVWHPFASLVLVERQVGDG